jgi:D-alanyl-D-alanine carboxypeptidase (penicillin-binding protein 5/6)
VKKLLGMILTLALAAGLAWPVYAESSTVPRR